MINFYQLYVGCKLQNIHTKRTYVVKKLQNVYGHNIIETNDGDRFNSDYLKHYVIVK